MRKERVLPHVIIKNLKHIVLKFVKLDYVDESRLALNMVKSHHVSLQSK